MLILRFGNLVISFDEAYPVIQKSRNSKIKNYMFCCSSVVGENTNSGGGVERHQTSALRLQCVHNNIYPKFCIVFTQKTFVPEIIIPFATIIFITV